MKGLFHPNPRSPSNVKGVGSSNRNGSGPSDLLPSCSFLAQQPPSDADVSMDESHTSTMSGVTTESSMTIGSPPRTQRRKRNPLAFRSIAGPTVSAASAAPGTGVSVRSRLFPDDVDLKQHDNHHARSSNNNNDGHNSENIDREPSSILKPFDLNQEFANSADPPFNSNNNATTTSSSSRAPDSPPTRVRNSDNGHGQTSSLTPFRPRHDRHAAMALRKRQADQDDLYGRDWGCDVEDAFSAAESPVDMYTSPRISPFSPGNGRVNTGNGKSANRMLPNSNHRSPFYSKHHLQQQQGRQQQQQQQLQYHKSPSHFQTLDGRTVQSKNPFSPMIFDETPTPTPSKPLPGNPGYSPAPGNTGLTHPLILTSDSLSFPVGSLNEDDASGGGKSHLVLRHKLQKRINSPCNSGSGVGRSIISQGGTNSGLGMGMDLLSSPPPRTSNHDSNNKNCPQLDQKASMYIRDGYPEQTGRYSFTGSPIKENLATSARANAHALAYSNNESSSSSKPLPSDFDKNGFPAGKGSDAGPQAQQDQDFCTNIHKIRRRNKGDDVVAAAAQGEASWKKKGMYIQTNNNSDGCNHNDNGNDHHNNTLSMDFNHDSSGFDALSTKPYYYNKSNQQQISKNKKGDSISPTDVFNYPQFRASPSDTSTLPPAPSKPIRRAPIRRYTPIRKTTGPPPTPMPGARESRPFDFDDAGNGSNNHHTHNNIHNGVIFDGEDSSDDEADDRISNAQRRRRSPNAGLPVETAIPPSRFYSDFDVIAELGSGSFGNVFKALSRLDGCFYAIKVAHRVAKGASDRDRMLKEVYALAALSDRSDTATFHIVRYHQAWMEEERLYIQTELCTTTLQAEIQQAAPSQLPIATRYKCLREILLALNFIHSNQMVHLDIKPENIFLKNDQFKLGDFGLVSKVSSHDVEEGDSRYMSMELLGGDHADLTKSDIFSLGIAMYEVCLGSSKTLPSNGPEWQKLRSGRILPPPNMTDELFQIIKSMMNPTYRERPSASDLLQLPELLSDEQKMMVREREKLLHASQALANQTKFMPKPKGLVRRNTWSAF